MIFPKKLLEITPENLKNKITFYSMDYPRTLCIATDKEVSEIALSKKVLESLVKNLNMGDDIEVLQAVNSNGEEIKLLFDEDLKNEFLKISDET